MLTTIQKVIYYAYFALGWIAIGVTVGAAANHARDWHRRRQDFPRARLRRR